jgi:ESS family glutamate:Na+ symporter
MFGGNGSFGLSLASIGFVVASVFGVLYINIQKKRGSLVVRKGSLANEAEQNIAVADEIPDSESIDKFTLQVGFVALAYAISFGFMCLLGILSKFTNSIAWGFNFLWASLAAMLIKFVVKRLRKSNIMSRDYINNYQMDRVSGFSFDLMIVAGVAAIEINDIKNYILPVVILSVVGAVVTYIYVRLVSKECFKGFEHEMFLMCYGTMTGTASNGMILMKEIDPGLRTPTSSLYILSNFPAMVMIAPLLFLLSFAAGSITHALIACAIFFVLWFAYTVFLFRRTIFKKKYENKSVPVWTDET